nr:hypothetical protein [Micromonospora sp. DSM 115978]
MPANHLAEHQTPPVVRRRRSLPPIRRRRHRSLLSYCSLPRYRHVRRYPAPVDGPT